MEYIYTIYQEKSFTKAANKLFVSQPALSAMVKKVEKKIETEIFDRTTNPISLTKDGEKYIYFLEKIMEIYNEMDDYFELNNKSIANTINVGGTSFFCSYIFPPVIQSFKDDYPKINFQFTEATNYELADRLSKSLLDLFIEVDDLEKENISKISWGKEAVILAVPKEFKINERLANKALTVEDIQSNLHMEKDIEGVNIKEFKDKKFIFMKKGNDSYSRGMNICSNAGFVPDIFMEVDSLLTACLLASEGHGVSFVRDGIPNALFLSNKLSFYKIDDPLAFRDIYIYYRNNVKLKSVVNDFINYMKDNPYRK